MKRFDITFFYGPHPEYVVQDSVIADMAASGITLAQLNQETAISKQALPIMQKYGLRADVGDPRIHKLYSENDFANVDAVVKQVVEDYAAFDNVEGFDICDEPHSEAFPILGEIVKAFRKYAPEKETVINLFPNYASPEQLRDTDYTAHLEHFVQQVEPHFLSYDHYHFLGRQKVGGDDGNEDERERLIRESCSKTEDRGGFFENIEEVRRVGLESGLEQMLIVLLVEHGPYRNLTRAELLWEVNMCLAYGFHRISYFTYWTPDCGNEFWQWDNGMCDLQGNKKPHYYDVQAINKSIMPIGEYLFNTTSAAVFHTGELEAGAKAFAGYGPVNSIEGGNAVIGFFEDGSAYLVNRDYQNAATFTVKANGAIAHWESGTFVPGDSTLTVTLAAGEGVLLRF